MSGFFVIVVGFAAFWAFLQLGDLVMMRPRRPRASWHEAPLGMSGLLLAGAVYLPWLVGGLVLMGVWGGMIAVLLLPVPMVALGLAFRSLCREGPNPAARWAIGLGLLGVAGGGYIVWGWLASAAAD